MQLADMERTKYKTDKFVASYSKNREISNTEQSKNALIYSLLTITGSSNEYKSKIVNERIIDYRQYIKNDYKYIERILELRTYAIEDEICVNNKSESDFWLFIEETIYNCKAELALTDNGNFRAIWNWDEYGHLGIEFFGDKKIQYVLFRGNDHNGKILRESANSTFEKIKKIMRNYKLEEKLQI